MTWTQAINPFNNLGLSALVAAIPLIFMFIALGAMRMKGHIAGLIAVTLAVLVAIAGFGMPAKYALLSTLYGAMFGLLPISWIVVTAVFLYNMTVKTGQFEIIKDSIAAVSDDRRLQALLIAFCFGAFLEGAAGFGTPVAITAAMLVGLGFNPLYAAGICLIANTAPVAWGAIGIPIITAGAVSGIDAMAISQMTGRQLPFLSVFVPFWLVLIMAGWKGAREVMPAILVCGVSFASMQWFSSNYLSPMLPDIMASLFSIVCLVIFLRYWKPRNTWRFADEPPATLAVRRHSAGVILKAWSPFIVLTVLIADWGLSPVKTLLNTVNIKIVFSGLDKMILVGGKPLSVVYTLNWLSATGTSILIAAVVTAFILRVGPGQFFRIFGETLYNLRFAIITVASVLGLAYVSNWSGMTTAMGKAFTVTGMVFPLLSAFLGWLGVFLTGSDTSSNALFGSMQKITAESMGINPVLTVATNGAGGVAGKMISPQSIVVGCASTGLVGREGDLFRFTLPHSIFFTALVGLIALLQAYVFPWMIPPMVKAAAASAGASQGGVQILAVSGVFVLILAVYAYMQKNGDAKKVSA
ncbi:MAG: lactate permease LctP family transporter [Peptococcaceae bacterium]|nr:lactate permease LctP family transporter [Peptococcaceae bacterium]